MPSCFHRAIPLAIASALLVAACSSPQPRPTPPQGTAPEGTPTPAAPTPANTQPTDSTVAPSHPALLIEDSHNATGIAACDDYLASYKGCHRAAGIFSPTTIDEHYQEMRDNLVKLSKDANMRDTLAARCTALANQLKKALHGKSCDAEPATASSSGD